MSRDRHNSFNIDSGIAMLIRRRILRRCSEKQVCDIAAILLTELKNNNDSSLLTEGNFAHRISCLSKLMISKLLTVPGYSLRLIASLAGESLRSIKVALDKDDVSGEMLFHLLQLYFLVFYDGDGFNLEFA